MDLRLCTQADLPAVLNLFRTSVHTLCRGEYTPAQLDAWAPEDLDNAPWARRVQGQTFLLAEEDGDLMGFASLEGPPAACGGSCHRTSSSREPPRVPQALG